MSTRPPQAIQRKAAPPPQKQGNKLDEQTALVFRLRELNDQLKNLLKQKYPDPDDQEFMEIIRPMK